MKNYINFIREESGSIKKSMVVMTAIAGVANGFAVATAIHTAEKLKPGELHFREFLLFFSLMFLFWYCKRFSMNESTIMVEKIISTLRMRILNKLRTTNLINFESIDNGVFYSALSEDASTISSSTNLAVNAVSSAVMLTFIVCYMAIMSMKALMISLLIISFMVLMYLRNEKKISGAFKKSTMAENTFLDNLGGLLAGFKDLKLNRRKYKEFNKTELEDVINESANLRIEAGLRLNVTILLAQTFLLIAIGGILFLLPQFDSNDIEIIPKLIALLIFASGPISDFAVAIPALTRAEAAINNIRMLEDFIDNGQSISEKTSEEQPIREMEWNKIILSDVFFQFPNKGNGRPFNVGPVDLEFNKGDITFIIGGNGSGKSTFLKVLTSLYSLERGRVSLDDTEIDAYNKASYRNLFSTIFSDYTLFRRLLGIDLPEDSALYELIKKMELSEKTSIENGAITNRELSSGQKKRLALIVSILEDKPVMIFDEWAADQDPLFRKFFYETLLPEFKAKGKTVIAVTHDDKYFDAADKIYKMEYGKFVPFKNSKTDK